MRALKEPAPSPHGTGPYEVSATQQPTCAHRRAHSRRAMCKALLAVALRYRRTDPGASRLAAAWAEDYR